MSAPSAERRDENTVPRFPIGYDIITMTGAGAGLG